MKNVLSTEWIVANAIMLGVAGACLLFFALVWCRIFSKAGYHAAMGLLMLVPGVNVVMLLMLGFSKWPVEREVKTLRGIQKAVRGADNHTLRRVA